MFDLAAIFDCLGKKWPVDYDVLEALGIEKKFELCKEFIERASSELRLSDESKSLRKLIFRNSRWLRLSPGSMISDSLVKTTHIEISDKPIFFSRLLMRSRDIRTLYQVSYYSPKFWLVLISDILVFFKRAMREFFI